MPLKAEVNLQRLLDRCERLVEKGITDDAQLNLLETVSVPLAYCVIAHALAN